MVDLSKSTFAMIKPHIVAKNKIGLVIAEIEKAGFKIKKLTMESLTEEEAQCFYEVHSTKPFYRDLCNALAAGPIVSMWLEKDTPKKSAVEDFRDLLGATDPKKAEKGTLREKFGESIDYNAVHGSDAPETAAEEIEFFFDTCDSGCCGMENCDCEVGGCCTG